MNKYNNQPSKDDIFDEILNDKNLLSQLDNIISEKFNTFDDKGCNKIGTKTSSKKKQESNFFM